MPSATVAVQSSSPELIIQSCGAQSEAMKQVLGFMDKKVRNMEKKKSKLDDYQAKKNKGERLNPDQLEALSKFQEVTHNLEFARELQKNLLSLGQDVQKAVKKWTRREQLQREEAEQKQLKAVLEVQFLLERLGDQRVCQALTRPPPGSALITEDDLEALHNFCKLLGPEITSNLRLSDQCEEASMHLWELLERRDKAVAGTTYKALKEILDRVMLSGYFDRAHTHQNGVCEDEKQDAASARSSESSEESAESAAAEHTQTVETEATELIDRQFIPESTYSTNENDQVEEWSPEAKVVNTFLHQSPKPQTVTPLYPTHKADPGVRKQAVQDLMAQMQGAFNFMQDSILEFDGQALDPAIVLAQPMKPALSVELQQRDCASGDPYFGSDPEQPERINQVSRVSPTHDAFSTPPPFQPPHTTEPRPQPDAVQPIQATMSLSSEQLPPPSSHCQAFPPVPQPSHSGGINVNAAPFQSMQAVFNLSSPGLPAIEMSTLKQSSQYQSTYGQPGFSSQTQHSVEQLEVPQEALPAVVGAFHTQEGPLSQQGPGFGRSAQPFYSSRSMPRGGPRNARGLPNGYRGVASNGFRGGFEGYRPTFSNTPNSGYGQTQFSTPRDFPNSSFPREGYQQSYKRGATQGPRGTAQVLRS